MCSIFQITCDGALFNRCLDCFLGKAAYIRNLQDNLDALDTELGNLIAKKNDVMRRVVDAERKQMIRLERVQRWISRVDAVKTEADQFIGDRSQEIEKLCVGGYCSKNCRSSYKFGKQVAKKLQDVKTLIGEGVFEAVATEVVAERAPEPVADKRPTEPTIVGLQSQLEQVWRCLVEESVGIIGLYGMGGVGKTTLLTRINNKFLESPTNFDCVIWVVVSKDLRLEKIQEDIGKKIGLSDDSWKNKSFEEKAVDILRRLGEKRFVLLLDDLWERVDLTEVGVPLPSPQNTTSKVVFTTRFIDVCGSMESHRKFKVACLSEEDAWELFREKVGQETLESDHEIVELAQTVAKDCIRSLFLQLTGDTTSIIDATAFADLKHLNELRIDSATNLEELKIDYTEIVRKRREHFVFRSLQRVTIEECHKLKDLTFLVFAPNLKSLSLYDCGAMEEIISVGKFAETPEMMGHISPFENLQMLYLMALPELKSVYWKPLPFTHLKEMEVLGCDQLKKLPLDSNSAKERKFVIRGDTQWWNRLQWEDEATQIAFRMKNWNITVKQAPCGAIPKNAQSGFAR
ncbi:hypothetical protein CUMW_259430 [Citrus unshiu]|uniref:Uncharacterized protein n=1 Tax=Citrus unshiu TaxID=55188 RepID=A0A2H5QU34_CITUN|nr:hypothetical protein CUMW_259430 [Citrus unshiu]